MCSFIGLFIGFGRYHGIFELRLFGIGAVVGPSGFISPTLLSVSFNGDFYPPNPYPKT
jgi:hypothetical protein